MKTKASATVACLALAVLTTYAQAPQAGGQRQAPSTELRVFGMPRPGNR